MDEGREKPGQRWLGLDLGRKTIGLAVSDPGGVIATSLGTLERRGMEKDLARLKELVKERGIEEIALGLPLHLSGAESEGSRRSREFAERLKAELGLPVHLIDESLSTARAREIMIEADLSRKKRKRKIDGLAAAIILQSCLDEQAERKGAGPGNKHEPGDK